GGGTRRKEVIGPHNIVRKAPPDGGRADGGREVHHHVDAGKGGLDRGEVCDVSLVARDAGHRATVETAHLVGVLIQVAMEGGADETGEAGDENDRSSHAAKLARVTRRSEPPGLILATVRLSVALTIGGRA